MVLLAAASVSHASITSKCPELLSAPSDSSPASIVGVVQDTLAADEDGKYGVVLSLQHVITGQDVMKDISSSQHDPQRYASSENQSS